MILNLLTLKKFPNFVSTFLTIIHPKIALHNDNNLTGSLKYEQKTLSRYFLFSSFPDICAPLFLKTFDNFIIFERGLQKKFFPKLELLTILATLSYNFPKLYSKILFKNIGEIFMKYAYARECLHKIICPNGNATTKDCGKKTLG